MSMNTGMHDALPKSVRVNVHEKERDGISRGWINIDSKDFCHLAIHGSLEDLLKIGEAIVACASEAIDVERKQANEDASAGQLGLTPTQLEEAHSRR